MIVLVPETLVALRFAAPPDRTVPVNTVPALMLLFCREMNNPLTSPVAVTFTSPPITPESPRSIFPIKPGEPADGAVPAERVTEGPADTFPFSASCTMPPSVPEISPRGVVTVMFPGWVAAPGT